MNKVFSIAGEHIPKTGLTISSPIIKGKEAAVAAFSLGGGTDISPESYDTPIIYFGLWGDGEFILGKNGESKYTGAGDMLIIKEGSLCGAKTDEGFIYTEIILQEELFMNNLVNAGEVIKIADLLPYEKGSIVNMDVAHNDSMKFVVMAFDEGTGLSPHRAPGDALIFALEGEAVIGYEGEEHEIKAGENFRFAKNGLHSVTAKGKFKMALLLVLK